MLVITWMLVIIIGNTPPNLQVLGTTDNYSTYEKCKVAKEVVVKTLRPKMVMCLPIYGDDIKVK